MVKRVSCFSLPPSAYAITSKFTSSALTYKLLGERSKSKEKSFCSKIDDALGEGLFGNEDYYNAIKNNAGGDNKYLWTNRDINRALDVEMLMMAAPIGELFNGVKWIGRGIAAVKPIMIRTNNKMLTATANLISNTLYKRQSWNAGCGNQQGVF